MYRIRGRSKREGSGEGNDYNEDVSFSCSYIIKPTASGSALFVPVKIY